MAANRPLTSGLVVPAVRCCPQGSARPRPQRSPDRRERPPRGKQHSRFRLELIFDTLVWWGLWHDLDLGRPIAAPLEQCAELLGVDLTTVCTLAAKVEPYLRADGTRIWSLMQLERQLRPEAYGRRRGGYLDRRQAPAAAPDPLGCCRANQSGRDRGCRRPKTKYEMGTTPAELTTVTTVAHTHFGPRTWLAGRRLRSMSAASLRIPSATAVMASSLRVRGLRSLHCLLAAMPSSAYTARIPDRLHLTSRMGVELWMVV